MKNCDEKCKHHAYCLSVYPDNDGGCWCSEDGFCVTGGRKFKRKHGNEVKSYESYLRRINMMLEELR